MSAASQAVIEAQPQLGIDYLTAEDAAEIIKHSKNGAWVSISKRRVQEYGAAGAIRTAEMRDPKSCQMMKVFLKEDVMRVAEEKRNPAAGPILPSPAKPPRAIAAPSLGSANLPATAGASGVPAILMPEVDARSLERSPFGMSEDAALTLAEAAGYKRIPESVLLAMVRTGGLPAIDVGVRRGGRWMVFRSDLDALRGQIQAVGGSRTNGEDCGETRK